VSARGWLTAGALLALGALAGFLLLETRRPAPAPIAPPTAVAAPPPPAAPPTQISAPPPTAARPAQSLPPGAPPTPPPPSEIAPRPPAPAPPPPEFVRGQKERALVMLSTEIDALVEDQRRAEQAGEAERARDLSVRIGRLRLRKTSLDQELRDAPKP
jgi:hypothetical protein